MQLTRRNTCGAYEVGRIEGRRESEQQRPYHTHISLPPYRIIEKKKRLRCFKVTGPNGNHSPLSFSISSRPGFDSKSARTALQRVDTLNNWLETAPFHLWLTSPILITIAAI